MDNTDRLNLQKMINANDVVDCTDEIRKKKHSQLIKTDIQSFLDLKSKYPRLKETNPKQYDNMCISRCNFLFTNYTDLFNRIKKDEIDLNILAHFISILKKIEDGELDQHNGAYMVGKLLKELYVDSALKKSEKLEKLEKQNKKNTIQIDPHKPKKISYKEFKSMQENL
jgi:hypothetical protein